MAILKGHAEFWPPKRTRYNNYRHCIKLMATSAMSMGMRHHDCLTAPSVVNSHALRYINYITSHYITIIDLLKP